jgi:hypothetical protein
MSFEYAVVDIRVSRKRIQKCSAPSGMQRCTICIAAFRGKMPQFAIFNGVNVCSPIFSYQQRTFSVVATYHCALRVNKQHNPKLELGRFIRDIVVYLVRRNYPVLYFIL